MERRPLQGHAQASRPRSAHAHRSGEEIDTLRDYETAVTDPSDVDGAYGFCSRLAARHYENFPVASALMPGRLRKHVAVLYAFARIADDFSDEPEYEGRRKACLEDWRSQLADCAAGRPARHPVFLALGRSLKELDLPVLPFDDLLSAFLQDVEKSRYETFDEVLDYCRRSANPVGRIVLMVHGYRDEELFRYSDAICTALQLANFWQDLGVDLRDRDRLYVPQEDFRAYGYSEADLRMGVINDKFRALMRHQVARARALFDQGRPLPGKLSFPLSLEIRLTWYGGREILKLIRRLNYETLDTRPKLSKWNWIPLIARSLVAR